MSDFADKLRRLVDREYPDVLAVRKAHDCLARQLAAQHAALRAARVVLGVELFGEDYAPASPHTPTTVLARIDRVLATTETALGPLLEGQAMTNDDLLATLRRWDAEASPLAVRDGTIMAPDRLEIDLRLDNDGVNWISVKGDRHSAVEANARLAALTHELLPLVEALVACRTYADHSCWIRNKEGTCDCPGIPKEWQVEEAEEAVLAHLGGRVAELEKGVANESLLTTTGARKEETTS